MNVSLHAIVNTDAVPSKNVDAYPMWSGLLMFPVANSNDHYHPTYTLHKYFIGASPAADICYLSVRSNLALPLGGQRAARGKLRFYIHFESINATSQWNKSELGPRPQWTVSWRESMSLMMFDLWHTKELIRCVSRREVQTRLEWKEVIKNLLVLTSYWGTLAKE